MPDSQKYDYVDLDYYQKARAAEGYFQLGMWEDALSELEELNAKASESLYATFLRIVILNNLKRWESAAFTGTLALHYFQDCGTLYLATAIAIRNSVGAYEAKRLLLKGEFVLKKEAFFYWLLACYNCQLGHFEDAMTELKIVRELDENFPLRVLNEPDLEPLWPSCGI